jgi:hypothetical protein
MMVFDDAPFESFHYWDPPRRFQAEAGRKDVFMVYKAIVLVF